MKKTATFFCIATLILGVALPNIALAAEPTAATPTLVINEFQTGGCASGELDGSATTACAQEDGTKEFIELHNQSSVAIDVSDWRIEYLSATHSGTSEPTRVLAELQGSVKADSYVLLSYANYLSSADLYFGADSTATGGLLAKSGGSIRIVAPNDTTTDLVGWGSAKQIGTWQRVSVPNPGHSAKRLSTADPTYSSSVPFAAPTIPTNPTGGGFVLSESTADDDTAANSDDEVSSHTTTCNYAILSEILPNPAGSDSGQEFIELYNPTDHDITLTGCQLRLGDTGKEFALPNIAMQPRTYAALYDSETKLTLPNASGLDVWLLSSTLEQAIQYPDALADDQSWADVDGLWQKSKPTPGAANIALTTTAAANDSTTATQAVATPTPCKANQERNPETNRCRTVVTVIATTPCKAGQERNSETGRCRNIDSANNTPTACKDGQEKNPETNRCRKIVAQPTVKPCGPGQERNAETNRCRNIATGADPSSTNIQDVESATIATKASWLVAGTAVAGAGGYGVYEWRRDIWDFMCKIKEQFNK